MTSQAVFGDRSIFDFRLKKLLHRLCLAIVRFSIFDFRLKKLLHRLRLAIVITNKRLVYHIVDRTRIQSAGDRSISQKIFNPCLAG
ncbi:hypothetical protein QUA56_10265 [Microcoleus sp. N3A4]|uniref:hypothetical protein n=1 Tax=Microcoleus sp. N3A4 TaxID=3055379 RepID=UPI002FD6C5A1